LDHLIAVNMPSVDKLLASVEAYRELMINEMNAMLRIPAMGPENGGEGEFERARFVEGLVRRSGFTDVEAYDSLDERVKLKVRPNIIARSKGRSEQTVWIVSHMDTVSPGEVGAWTRPPFEPHVVDGKLYGRGAEDNGQAVISSIFAARALLDLGLVGERSLGLAIVADEEAGSDHGIKFLLAKGLFRDDDIIYVPDFGVEDGAVIEVAEKSLIWLRFRIEGKQVHASTPEKGLNALRIGSELLLFLADHLAGKYADRDPLFMPPNSTFEPTKRLANVENINTVPGEDIFFFDIRLLPHYDPDEVVTTCRHLAEVFEERTGAKISVVVDRIDAAGRPAALSGLGIEALSGAIKRVLGVDPKPVGIGGGTCAKEFRRAGMDAYVWETVDELAHQVDEYAKVDNIVGDAKVFAVLLAMLCFPQDLKH
jgi:succinyl-diaminopimelate desuccinylase